MSAMKMDFICKDSPEKSNSASRSQPPPTGKLSALLNSSHGDSDIDMDDHLHPHPPHDTESMDVDAAAATPSNSNVHTHQQTRQPIAKRLPLAATATSDDAHAHAHATDEGGDASDYDYDSEDDQVERAAYQNVDLNPAVDLVHTIVRECLEAGKTYNKSITAKTTQLIMGCDSVLLELESLAAARAASRASTSKFGSSTSTTSSDSCDCTIALGILPLVHRDAASTTSVSADPAKASAAAGASTSKPAQVDAIAEDLTDRVLSKVEASLAKVRELAEMIQATSMQGEAHLIAKATVAPHTIATLATAVHASAAAATAAAIANQGDVTKQLTPLQLQKLQQWYVTYPRPLTDELTLMRTILSYAPYTTHATHASPALTIAAIREWFKRRRERERRRFVLHAIERGREPQAAADEIQWRMEQRVERLRATADLHDLVKEVERVRTDSVRLDALATAFATKRNVEAFMAASQTALLPSSDSVGPIGRSKRLRTIETDASVKPASYNEVAALQRRLQSQLALPHSRARTVALQQVVDVLRSVAIAPDVRIQTNVVADLQRLLEQFVKPTLLRATTIALLEQLGMQRRTVVAPVAIATHDADDDAVDRNNARPVALLPRKHDAREAADAVAPPPPASASAPAPAARVSRRGKREKGLRPMKFTMEQVTALENWFQQTYKPTQQEMETYLAALNAPALRDATKQPLDVSMTQLRRWFNKRRCLRRPPFALMTTAQQQDVVAGRSGDSVHDVGNAGGDTDEMGDDGDDDDDDDGATNASDDGDSSSSDDDDDSHHNGSSADERDNV